MKKNRILLSLVFAFFSLSFAGASDFALRLMPTYNITDNSNFEHSIGGTAGFEFVPLYLRGRDTLTVSALVGLLPIQADGINTLNIFSGNAGLGYSLRFNDRLSVSAEGFAGIWSISKDKEQNTEGVSGICYGGRLGLNYHLIPELTLGVFAGYAVYDYNPEPFVKNTEIGLSLRYSLTKGLFSKNDVKITESNVKPLFPVFYSRYDDHSFGFVTFVNNEPNDIYDIHVYVYIEQYMTNATKAFEIPHAKRGETFTADLTAFLNENILNNLSVSETKAIVSVSYKSLGKRITVEEPMIFTTFNRNAMTWEDDRQAAAFVSAKDVSASMFAKRVKAIVKDSLSSSVPENIQYAAAIFAALKEYGINYVVDPSSAFTDNIGTASVDFLQFPYQTLRYHGGDCDDLTILNCALLEAIGIETAFITVPGHIYMAFDSGLKPDESAKAGECIVVDGKVWVPLEITLPQDSFALERQTGIRQWRKYNKDAKLLPLRECWSEFAPVAVPDSDIKLEHPSMQVILREFKKQI